MPTRRALGALAPAALGALAFAACHCAVALPILTRALAPCWHAMLSNHQMA